MKLRIPIIGRKRHPSDASNWPIEPDRFEGIFLDQVEQFLKERCDTEEEIEQLSEALASQDKISEVAHEVAEDFYPALLRQGKKTLRGHRRDQERFRKRHSRLWRKALDLFEMYLLGCFEIGASLNRYERLSAMNESPYKFDVLIRLHARAVQTGNEVSALLVAGFADGAHARWRTAHELAVISILISRHGEELARRYLEYQVAEIDEAIKEHQAYADQLEEKPPSEEYAKQIHEEAEQLRRQYGNHFTKRNGWASEIAPQKNPSLKELEVLAGIDHLRPYYRMASDNVHAGPKGSLNRLGLGKKNLALLVGPSNYGLTDPAHGTAISILQVMSALLLFRPRLDSIVYREVLTKFVYEIGQTFSEIQRSIENRDTN